MKIYFSNNTGDLPPEYDRYWWIEKFDFELLKEFLRS